MKRLLILSMVLIMFLAGCAEEKPNETTWPGEYDPTVPTTLVRPPEPTDPTQYAYPPDYVPPTEPSEMISVQYLPREVENDEDLPVVKWLCALDSWYGGRTHPWNEDAVLELNDMLKAQDMPFRVQMVILSTNRHEFAKDWFSVPEFRAEFAEADLVFTYMNQAQMRENLFPITDDIGMGGALQNAVPHSLYWNAATLDGETYAIPCAMQNAVSTGWEVSTSLMEAAGLTEEDFRKNFWEMDDVFARIYEANGRKGFLNDNGDDSGVYLYHMESDQSIVPNAVWAYLRGKHLIGSCYGIDYSNGKPEVVNVLELDDVRAYQEAVVRYKKAKYTTSDFDHVLRYTTLETDQVYKISGEEKVCIPVTTPVLHQSTATFVTGISAVSVHKAEALALLELIAEDEAFRMQLLYGQEDEDYMIRDGYYQRVVGEDGTYYCLDFLSPLAPFCGMELAPDDYSTIAALTESAGIPGESGEDKLENLRSHLDHSQIFLPVEFDFAGYEEELAQLHWNFRRYYPYYTNHKHVIVPYGDQHRPEMTPALYDLMLSDLREAGGEDVQYDLQYQLDKWLQENP